MTIILYNIFLFLFKAGANITAFFNSKNRKWVKGRKGLFKRLRAAISPGSDIIWMHCSSLGEYEQGRPILEQIRDQYPGTKILLTFFSPSGYEVQKEYKGADWVFYLPMDGPVHAKKFIGIVNPRLVIFVKYEFWYYYVKEISRRKIPLLLVSALFSENTVFFKWYGRLQRKMLPYFSHFFVQNDQSKKLLGTLGYTNITVTGDTRFDRVIEIAESWQSIPVIENFIGGQPAIVAGSTWREDEIILQKALAGIPDTSLKLIIAPHELEEKDILDLEKMFPYSIRYSKIQGSENSPANANCLIIDNMGMLSRLYKYGMITFVGGGMTSYGVHNVLEAAVYGKPVIIGPFYRKYIEAIGLVESGGGIVIRNEKELAAAIVSLLKNDVDILNKTSIASSTYVRQHAGATQKILQYIQENRLLTS